MLIPKDTKKVTHKDYQTRQWPMLQPFPARTEKLERHIVLEKGFSEKISRENSVQFIQTILSRSKCFILISSLLKNLLQKIQTTSKLPQSK